MIYLFTWENYFRNELINKWKLAFWNKYSDLNIFHIKNYSEFSLNYYSQNLFSTWLFSSKSFFIIDDFPFWLNDANSDEYTDYFLNNIEKVDSENIIIFNSNSVDKRSKLYKLITKIWEIKDFSIENQNDLEKKIIEIYNWKLDLNILRKIIDKKWVNFNLIKNEIDKILITKESLSLNDIENFSQDVESNIFDIINLTLNLDIKNALTKLNELNLFLDKPYLLYNMLVSNFRIYFYIFKLKENNLSNNDISNILQLWNRRFLLDKSFKINKLNFYNFYYDLLNLDSLMKNWKLIWNESKDFMYELQNRFLINLKRD